VDRRYQVFVSSTYFDLKDERQAVISTLLNMDVLPAGMELFPATDDDAWTLIQQVIDESDYYLLVIGGRYGAIDDETQRSYTEKEFDYAISVGKPTMAFLHGDPGKIAAEKTDQNDEAREKLNAFREKVERHKHVKYWTGSDNLAGQVALSFPKLQRAHPAVGWVRGDVQTSTESLEEMNALRKRLSEVETQLEAARTGPPPGTDNLAQGSDTVTVTVRVVGEFRANVYPQKRQRTVLTDVEVPWDDVFAAVGPALFDEADQDGMHEKLDSWFSLEAYDAAKAQFGEILAEDDELVSVRVLRGSIFDDYFDTLLVQLRALGLITKSERKRSVKDTGAYWTLTPYGDTRLTALRAIQRGQQRPDNKAAATTA
jgi:hypothetical protein